MSDWNTSGEDGLEGDWDPDFFMNTEYTDTAHAISLYVYPVLLLLGTLGNLLSFLVMFRLSQDVLSSCVYLSSLAVMDLLVLYTLCGNQWLAKVSHLDLSNMLLVSSSSVCKVYPFVYSFIFHLSRWLMVCLALEGVLATCFPQKIIGLCSLSRAKAVVMFLTVILICVNIHFFWSFELTHIKELNQPEGRFCNFVKHGSQHIEVFQRVIWPLFDLLVGEVLPYAIVMLCCIVMLCQICSGRYRGDGEHRQWRKRYQLNPDAVDELKVVICVVCVLFWLLCVPKFCYMTYRYILEKYEVVEYSFQLEARQVLGHSLCSLLEYVFLSCAKFTVYVSTSSVFREQLKALLFQCCGRQSLLTRDSERDAVQEKRNLMPRRSRAGEDRYIEEWDSNNYRYRYYKEEGSNANHEQDTASVTVASTQVHTDGV